MRRLITFILLTASLAASAKLTQFILRGYIEKQDYTRAEWRREMVDSVYVDIVRDDTIPVSFKMLRGNDTIKMATSGELRMLVQGGVGSYSLLLNREGYEPLRHDFKIASEGQDVIYIRSIPMEARRENSLNEVEVLGTAIKMVMKGDTIVYDSRAFKTPEGSTLDALVRQLPGAELDEDGSIKVNGRKVSSLLLNGNDFFQGDPNVALKNLPAYTVDKIKVYDRQEKDDHITLASHKLNSAPDEENLVMDVMLKKEFAMATILNVEGGYGPGIYPKDNASKRFDSRYIGRAFVIGFGKKYRFSAFGNVNNIQNNSKASSDNRDWGWDYSGDGLQDIAIGGFDVFYTPVKKWELTAEMTYTRTDVDYQSINSTTRFYDSGNLYERDRSNSDRRDDKIFAKASMRYIGDNVSVFFRPNIEWNRYSVHGCSSSATFNVNPYEKYRGQALDSLTSLRDHITTSMVGTERSSGDPSNLAMGLSLNATWRPKSARGVAELSASGSDTQRDKKTGILRDQTHISDPTADPIRQMQWDDDTRRDTEFGANMSYSWDKKIIGAKHMRTFSIKPAVGWDIERNFNDDVIELQHLLEDIDPENPPLPSVTAPESLRPYITMDANNTVKSLYLSNDMMGRIRLNFSTEPVAPSDSGFNPRINATVNFTHRQFWRHYTYDKPHVSPTPFHYVKNSCEPTEELIFNFNFGSGNRINYFNITTGYTYKTSLQSMSLLVPTVNNANPLYISLGPEPGQTFATPASHRVSLNGWYYDKVRRNRASLYGYFNYDVNSLAAGSTYDPSTGVTTTRPMSISGNWNTSIRAFITQYFDKESRWALNISPEYLHTNNIDYVSAIGAPERSLVRTDNIGGEISMSYRLKNGTGFSLGGQTQWQHSTSPRASFKSISAWESHASAGIYFYLPWQIEGETTLLAKFRRGYEDAAMNTTEWIWNVSVQKTFLKGNMTVKLNAVDILGQLSNVTVHVNAQGRYEYWNNSLPRYAMLTLSYRFNVTPSALKSN